MTRPRPHRASARPRGGGLRLPALLLVAGSAAALGAAVPVGAAPTSGRGLPPVGDPPPEADQDFDGLSNHLEQLLGTSDLTPDTDGDMVPDPLELALGSDPADGNVQPASAQVSVTLAARTQGGQLHVTTALYLGPLQLPGADFHVGFSYDGVVTEMPLSAFLNTATLTIQPGMIPGDLLALVETVYPEAYVQDFGYLGFYATVAPKGGGGPVQASVLNLFDHEGHTVRMLDAPASMQGGGGTIYQPLAPDGELPDSTFSKGFVCWQLTSPAGTAGASVVLDVEDAGCEDLDASCNASACLSSIGTSITVLDVGALAGGG